MKRIGWVIAILSIVVGAAAGAVGFTLYDQYWAQLPPLDNLLDYRPPVATRVYADDGSLVGEFFFEKRYLTPINNIPPLVQNAFIAAEDSDFRSHRGIDPKSIVRAFVANLRAGGVVQGGSTITQQVVKALVLSPERSYKRKLREIMLSLRLEQELTKDEILYLYLNEIYLGDGNYGVGAAARSYFGKAVTELTAGEAALLAGLPQAPSRYSPTRNPAGARSRQLYVLRRMHEEGFIDARQYAEAVREAPPVLTKDEGRYGSGSYYTEYVRQYLGDNYGKQATYHKGFNIYTGMNIAMQRAAEVAVANGINRIDGMLGYRGPVGRVEGKELEERLQRDGVDLGLEVLEENTVYEGVVTRVDGSLITVVVG
ncbi:MAG: transglycosylase domain-containing protein, partial [Candidatus Binatia bacterium]